MPLIKQGGNFSLQHFIVPVSLSSKQRMEAISVNMWYFLYSSLKCCNNPLYPINWEYLGHACACKFALKCFALKRFALKCFALKGKHRIGLTPLYWHQVGRRTGQGQCQEKFLMVGRQMADKKRRKNFILGLPLFRGCFVKQAMLSLQGMAEF